MEPSVKLVTITPDAERQMAYVARVSSAQQDNPEYSKLLSYCIKHGHWSVFEHAHMTLEISSSRTIARQLLRHRSFTFQEFSQRYAQTSDDAIYTEARRQDTKNRQNSIDDLSDETREWFLKQQEHLWKHAYDLYEAALIQGIAKECARVFLPEGMTPSKLYMTGNVRSWIHFIELRALTSGAQKEIAQLALSCKDIFCRELPVVASALGW